ncbi:sensor histidine kinase [Deinococcus marmoris]|uniref:sensor histidine kinase n=1 Tax=Deinococcus marmoris TaxID=249408 RepID=UPI0006909D76|nr:ATP-binding protein [Deinococcus marmoris]
MTRTDPVSQPAESEMAALIRDFDWAATPLGPRANWPVSLRVLTDMLLCHPLAMTLLWGSELIQLYNDPCRVLMGDKHPGGLGQPNRTSWSEDWPVTAPIYDGVLARGETFKFMDQPLTLRRHGHDERVFLNLTYSPVCGDDGAVGGVLVTVIETTRRVQAEQAAQTHRREMERVNAALEVFAVLTRDLALDTDPLTLIHHAQQAVLPLLDTHFSQYYEPVAGRWYVRSQVGHVQTPALQAALDAGVPFEKAPTLQNVWHRGAADYQDVYAPPADGLPHSEAIPFATVALPVRVSGQMQGVLVFALPSARTWTPADHAVLATVERSLSLALERAAKIQQVEQQQAALQEANEELEAFSYSVSHDLRTPVRHIKGFSELLRRDVGTGLGLKATHYLTVIDEAAGRMNVLIDAMLELSRAARLPLRSGPVDLEALVIRGRQELEVDAYDRNVQWQVSPLPLVTGDHDTLQQVITNLLSNAVKYTRPRQTAVIEVWAEERAGEWAVFVRDNGVGFDPRYQDRLFGVFQRLHLEREFEGTGVGLANVRRIVTRHGGTVSASSVTGEGATFGFTLPR